MQKKLKIQFFKNKKYFFIGFAIIFTIFVIDIWSKRIAFAKVDEFSVKTGGIYDYIQMTYFFNIVKVINTGVSFGMFNGIVYGQIILSIITSILIGFLFYLSWQSGDKFLIYTYSAIIGGGIGNLYDRIIYGGVFDFLDFHIKQYHWPAFNIADSVVCVGVFLLLIKELRDKK
ncbi:MAG: signal peptidase II [Rickettsiales bacterium]|jgi:signal peptidase II|nr:signal peptidase II [Rickettsiales bacterium]